MFPLVLFLLSATAAGCLIIILSFCSSAIHQLITEKTARATDGRHYAEQQRKSVGEEVQAAVSADTAVADAIKAYHRERDSHERERAERERVTIIVLCFTGAFALFAAAAAIVSDWIFFGQLSDANRASEQQHADTERALVADVRPVLWLTKELRAATFIERPPRYGRFMWDLPYTNYGKGPANQIMAKWCLTVVDAGSATTKCSDPTPIAPIPPGGFEFSTAASDYKFTSQLAERVKGTDYALVLTANITYTDAYGHPYETDICFQNLASGAVNFCPRGNEIK